MAKFHIGTPGGYDVEVNADNEAQALEKARSGWQSLPKVVATTDDGGRVLERGGKQFFVSPGYSTSDPGRISKILEGANAGQLSRQSFDEQSIAAAPVAARATKFVEGVPFVGTYVDEALGSVLGPEATAGIRAQSAAMDRQRPGQSLAANLAGGLLSGGAAAAALPAAALPTAAAGLRTIPGMAAGAGIGAGSGAVEGLISGAGRGTDAQSRGEQAQTGATFGAVGGGLLGAAAPLATKAIGNIAAMFRRSDIGSIAKGLGISQNAAKVIKNTFDQGGDVALARANLQKAGSQAMLADAGEAAQALLDATAAQGGVGAQRVKSAVNSRATQSAQAVTQTLDNTLGAPPAGPRTAVAEIARRTAPQRAEAYQKAFSQAIDFDSPQGKGVSEALSRISPKVLNDAIEEANEQLLSQGASANVIRATLNDAGDVVLSDAPNVQQLNEIKIALGALAEDAKGDLGRATAKSRRYSDLARNLRTALGEAVPDYSAAVRLGGDKIAEQNAFELGADILKTNTRIEDIGMMLGDSPSLAQVEAAKSGMRDAISKALGDVRAIASDPNMDARQLRKAVGDLGSDNARAKGRALLGAEADALFDQIDEASQSLLVRDATARGSQTASRQAQAQAVDEITAPGLLGTAARGEPVDAGKRMIQAITGQTDEFAVGQRQKIYADIAKALTEKRGDAARSALESLNKAMAGQSITDAETSAIAKAIADIGFVAGAPTITRGLLAEEQRLSQ